MTQTHSDRKHSTISPSSLKHFADCPGYMKDDDDSTPHPVTLEGTLIHEALDTGDWSGLNADQKELAKMCEDFAGMLPTSGGEIVKEPKLDIIDEVFGHVDQIQIDGRVADMLDWKMGWNRVEAADVNLQGQAYALGAFKKWDQLQEITVHFVQPRLGYATSHTYTRDEVAGLATFIKGIIARVATATQDEYTPVPSTCQYCTRADCPAVALLGHNIAKKYAESKNFREAATAKLESREDPDPITLPDEIDPKLVEEPENLAKLMEILPVIERWCGSLKKRAKDLVIEEGVELPGYEIAHRAARKSITNGAAAWEVVKDRVSHEDFVAVSTPSLTDLKKLYTKDSKRGQKTKDAAALEQSLVDLDALSGGGDQPFLRKIKNK
jgi:hypothetical protein